MRQFKREKLDNIQALRFAAAAMVLLTHITFYVNARLDSTFKIWHPGAAGVSLFFVISGIVIYLSSADLPLNVASATLFIRRRVQRIVPLYWLITTVKVALILALPAALIKNQATVSYVIGSYLLVPVQNASGHMEPVHGVGWSLIHEMFFYYVFAAGLMLRLRPVAFSFAIITTLCILGMFFKASNAVLMVIFSEQNLLFVVGMMLAHVYVKGLRLPTFFALTSMLVGIVAMLYDPARDLWYPVFGRFDIGAVLVMTGALTLRVNFARKSLHFMIWLGDGSYSVYLIHPLLAPAIIAVVAKIHPLPLPILVALTWVTCLAAGQLLFLYVESPLNRKARVLTDSALGKQGVLPTERAASTAP